MRYLLPQVEDVPIWPIVAVPAFIILFGAIVFWTYKKSRKAGFEETSMLPLQDSMEEDKK